MRKSLDVQIDHGMHCKAFSPACSVDTGGEKKDSFLHRGACVHWCVRLHLYVCRLQIEARRHMAVQLHGLDSTI